MTENGGWASDGDSNIGSILLKKLSNFVTGEEGRNRGDPTLLSELVTRDGLC
jgi:hypothetical protein